MFARLAFRYKEFSRSLIIKRHSSTAMNSRMVSPDLTPKHDAAIIRFLPTLDQVCFVLGGPGSGKGTVCRRLRDEVSILPPPKPKSVPDHVLWVLIN